MKAFATHVLHGSYPHYKPGAQLDEDDDLPTLLRRSRKLPGRILTVRTADGRHMSHRANAPTSSAGTLPDETTDASALDSIEDVRVDA